MDDKLIRVKDFAQACGCTPQNIYIHLKNYAAELEGHIFQGKGRQGQLLDEFAQEFLRSIMYPKEISTDATVAQLQEEVEKLRSALFRASQERASMATELAQIKGDNQQLRFDNGNFQRLLEASKEAQEAQAEELKQARIDVQALTEMNQETQGQLAAVRGELSDAQDTIDTQERNLEISNKARERLAEELEVEKQHNKALKSRNWFERLTRKGE